MRRKRIPSYRHHKATGQAVVSINGRDCYLGLYDTADSHRKYELLVSEWLRHGSLKEADPAQPIVEPQTSSHGLTVYEVMFRFLEYGATYYSQEGRELEQFKLSIRPLREVCGARVCSETSGVATSGDGMADGG